MKYLGIVGLMFICCNYGNKLECYQSKVDAIKKKKVYHDIMVSAKEKLPQLINNETKKPIIDSSYIISNLIDDAIFFNSDSSKCLLLVLQKTSDELKLDQVLILHGTETNAGWLFSPDRLPKVPYITYTVNKNDPNGILANNSFDILSKKGRLFVLNAGTVKTGNCVIDTGYWFGE